MKTKRRLTIENSNLLNENKRIKNELDIVKTQFSIYKYITNRHLNQLRKDKDKDKDKEFKEKQEFEEKLFKLLNENVNLTNEVRELNNDLMHILKSYEDSEKEEHTINDMLLNELKNKFRKYSKSHNLYFVPYLEFVNGDYLENVYLTFFEDKYIFSLNNATGYGLINNIKL